MSSDDEDIRRPGRRTSPSDAGNESPAADLDQMDVDDDDDRDLFGSDGDEGLDDIASPPHVRYDIGSDDDNQSLLDRMEVEPAEDQEEQVRELYLSRAPMPATSTGEIYTMHLPDFLTVEKKEFSPKTYTQPHSVASSSICWRRDPTNKDLLQSNARFIQWEDGSITLQLASAPKEQYQILSKNLQPLSKSGQYDSKLDSHLYLGAALETQEVIQMTGRVTHGLTVQPTVVEDDAAIKQLQESLTLANANKKSVVRVDAKMDRVDPEQAAREEQLAERENVKQERRQQLILERERERENRTSRRAVGGGLDGGDLTTRPRRPRVTNRRGEINTDDEAEYDSRPRNREDEYDEDDGFLVNSDEEIDQDDDEEEEEELDDDVDAEGEVDDEIVPVKPSSSSAPVARSKRRRIVDDDDEDEL